MGVTWMTAAAPPPPVSIQVPPGFEIVRVAAPPLVKFPMLGGFDDRGRLFVAESAGLALLKAELAEKTPSWIRMLEDTDGDGIFDRSTIFADRLVYPKGVLWHDGALYVASPPSIWRFEDTDGDGKADTRKEIATGFNYSGNAADVHGPFLHPNGRVYWTHAHKGHEVYQRDGSLVSKAAAARVWSSRADGTDIQIHAGGGMDNPVELVFNQEGDIFGTVDLFEGSPRNDAVVHWVYGGVYPRRDQERAIAEFKRTGDLLGSAVSLGHVAPAGMVLRRSESWGSEFQDNLFLAEFNTRRIMRVALERHGASFRGVPEVFATAADPGVHFTDVFEDADGSLLIIDTGGWFTHGCSSAGPTRTDIFGGVYRIRRNGAPRVEDPRGLVIAWSQLSSAKLIDYLADPRPAVRERTLFEVARKGPTSVAALTVALQDKRYLVRSNALWALTRIATPEACAAARSGLVDSDHRIRQTACHSAFITADADSADRLVAMLADEAPGVRREAAHTLGRLRSERAIAELGNAAAATENDPVLMHALIYALIEIAQPAELRKLLAHAHTRGRRAALIALDQISKGEVSASVVFDALRSSDAELHSAALQIALRHPEWGAEAATYLAFLYSPAGSEALRTTTGPRLLTSFLRGPEVRAWLRTQLDAAPGSGVTPLLAMQAIAQSPGTWDQSWHTVLSAGLRSKELPVAQAALRAISVHRKHDFGSVLREAARDPTRPPSFRVAALQAAAGGDQAMDGESFQILTAPFVTGGSAEARSQAAAVLSGATLNREQMLKLAALLPAANPLELPPLLGAFRRGPADLDIGAVLLAKLQVSPGRWGLIPGQLSGLFRRFTGMPRNDFQPLIAELIGHAAAKESRIAELEKTAVGGDPTRGREAFVAGKGACVSCHRIGETGTKMGPDLSRIGASRTTRDLVEAIAFPSASIARGYESFQLQTNSGEALVGTIPRETSDEVIVATADGREIPVPRASIAKLEPISMSQMPPGLDRALEPQSFADLVAYLTSLK